jgi:hypothetical protein
MSQIVCAWTTYKGSHCKRIVQSDDKNCDKNCVRFCNLHSELIAEYQKLEEDDDSFCETFKEIRVTPRSYKHIKTIMQSMQNEDDIVQVYLSGGSIEDANITNSDYLILDSDNSKFYYNPRRGQNKAKDLKVILNDHCKNKAIVCFSGTKYCEDCYRTKIKDAPRISLIV